MSAAPGQISGGHPLVQVHVQKAWEALKGHLLCQRRPAGLRVQNGNQRDVHGKRKGDRVQIHGSILPLLSLILHVLLCLHRVLDHIPEPGIGSDIVLPPSGRQFLKELVQHPLRIFDKGLQLVLQMLQLPLPPDVSLVAGRPRRQHLVQQVLVPAQIGDQAGQPVALHHQLVVHRQLPQHLPQLQHGMERRGRAGHISGRQEYLELLLKPLQRLTDLRSSVPPALHHLHGKGPQGIVLPAHDAFARCEIHPKVIHRVLIHVIHGLPRPPSVPDRV